jgi:hypothetical protein
VAARGSPMVPQGVLRPPAALLRPSKERTLLRPS